MTYTLFNLLHQRVPVITPDLCSVVVGQLLSDAYAWRSSPTANTRLEWSFGTEFQLYAEWLAVLLAPYGKISVKTVIVKATSKATGITKGYTNYRLKTAVLAIFNPFFDMFYTLNPDTLKYVKVVPANILSLMNAIVLAHLIMGDGNFHTSHNQVRIFTNSYTHEDCVRLASAITNIGITTEVLFDRVGKNGSKQYILVIRSLNLEALRTTVLPHMHPSMLYRIGL